LETGSTEKKYYIVDISANGTLLNGEKISKHVKIPLHSGDKIGLLWRKNGKTDSLEVLFGLSFSTFDEQSAPLVPFHKVNKVLKKRPLAARRSGVLKNKKRKLGSFDDEFSMDEARVEGEERLSGEILGTSQTEILVEGGEYYKKDKAQKGLESETSDLSGGKKLDRIMKVS
jgi:hypothetical protein